MKLLKNRITKTVGIRDEYGRLASTKEVEEWEWSIPKIIIASVLALILLLTLISCISTVPTGYTGILTTFGRVEDRTMGAGVHFIAPWQKIVKLDNRTQKVEINAQAFSSDIQQVDLKMSVNYCIDQATAQNLYKTVGKQYYDTVLYPRILENTKSVFAKYSAEELVSHRQDLSGEIQELLTADATRYGIQIVNFSVEDIDFTDAFTNAVEAKQVAAQNKLTAETQQAQKTMEQEQIAKRRIIDANAAAEEAKIQAEADLEVTKIQADAAEYAGQKEAAKNKAISEWLTDTLIRYYYIQAWDGKLPQYMFGANTDTTMMFPIGE
jgi:regulator of protease activity HflC (stomatin/prohibitin superfamily)